VLRQSACLRQRIVHIAVRNNSHIYKVVATFQHHLLHANLRWKFDRRRESGCCVHAIDAAASLASPIVAALSGAMRGVLSANTCATLRSHARLAHDRGKKKLHLTCNVARSASTPPRLGAWSGAKPWASMQSALQRSRKRRQRFRSRQP